MTEVKCYRDNKGYIDYEYEGYVYPFSDTEPELESARCVVVEQFGLFPFDDTEMEENFPDGLENYYVETIVT